MKYMLIQDNDCHWYVIPADKFAEFDKWLADLDSYTPLPGWAKSVGGAPSLVTFENYEIS